MKRLFITLSYVALTACATTSLPTNAPPEAVTRSSALAAQPLNSGECGLFVWDRSPDRAFILFSSAETGVARWYDGNAEQKMTIEQQSGVPQYGQFPIQSFDRFGLSLSLSNPQAIEQGTRYSRGLLSHEKEGWATRIPVQAIASCGTS